jgi:hypothetical protein
MPLGVLPRHDWLDAIFSHRRLNVANAEVVPKAGALRSRLRLAFPSDVIAIGGKPTVSLSITHKLPGPRAELITQFLNR